MARAKKAGRPKSSGKKPHHGKSKKSSSGKKPHHVKSRKSAKKPKSRKGGR
jgi:hypothetical protein